MDSRINVIRILPDGTESLVSLFHISLEGLETATICRDDEDYDVIVKNIFLCSLRENVIVVIYGAVSNHAHVAILAADISDARSYANSLKKVQSMWIRRKYGEENILHRTEVDISPVDTIQYARNALAYIPRNALDNGAPNVSSYRWTGYRAMFCGGRAPDGCVSVNSLSTRETERIFHTGDSLRNVSWMINGKGEIEPATACDWRYLETVFNHDCSFWLRMIGSVNTSEMEFKLVEARRRKMTDGELYRVMDEIAVTWFNLHLADLSLNQKIKMIYYLDRKYLLSVPQTARCIRMERATVARLLGRTVHSDSTSSQDGSF